MSELAFAKQFLTALDSRPIKLSSDNVVDPRSYPAQSAYILPRHTTAKRKRGDAGASTSSTAEASGTAAGASTSTSSSTAAQPSGAAVTVSLKPTKPGPPAVSLPGQPPTKSMYDIKVAYAAQARLDPAKIKLLRSKKPVADSKSLRDVLSEGGDETTSVKDPQAEIEVEFSVMVMPGAALGPAAAGNAATGPAQAGAGPVAQGPSGVEVLSDPRFWDDLKGFLLQRVRDEEETQKLVKAFKSATESSAAKP